MAKKAQPDKMKELAAKYAGRSALTETGEDRFIASGSVIMDAVLSGGRGVPLGKFIQISSESGLGKTTIVLHVCKAALKAGKRVAYIDVENGVNDSQLDGIGITPYRDESFFLYKISTFEEAEEVMDVVIEDPDIAYIVIDSITALVPGKFLEGSIADNQPGLHARYASDFLKKYRAKIGMQPNKPTVWFVNQMRTHFNFRGISSYAPAGGAAQKFFCDIRLNMRESKKLKKTVNTVEGSKQVQYGSDNILWADKNRYSQPFVEAIITVIFGKGVSNILAYYRMLQRLGVTRQAGAFYSIEIPDHPVIRGQGMAGLQEAMKENFQVIREYVMANGGFKLADTEDFSDGDVNTYEIAQEVALEESGDEEE